LGQTRGLGLAGFAVLGTLFAVAADAAPAIPSMDNDSALTGGYSDAPDLDTLDPTDPLVTVQRGFAQPGAIFPAFTLPGRAAYEAWREDLLQRHDLRFAFSAQMLSQYATATAPGADEDVASGGIATFELIWSPHDRGGPTESSFVLRYGWRGNVFGNAQNPASFGLVNLGANWSNYEFTNWQGGFKVEDFFLQQWFLDRRANFRIGNMGPQAVLNFSRFKDARVSFTASPYAFNDSIPWPTFGFGASLRVNPKPESDLYMVGSINDMNGDPAALGLDWSTAFEEGQFFYGFEIGNFWRRGPGDFDTCTSWCSGPMSASRAMQMCCPTRPAGACVSMEKSKSAGGLVLPATPTTQLREAASRRPQIPTSRPPASPISTPSIFAARSQ
jgi:hypothetical protein